MTAMLDTSMDNDFNDHQEEEQHKARVIIPPPDIKSVIDKTANFVAKNGANFEALILKTEQNNLKFNFLRHLDDPYRPYYMQKINDNLGISAQSELEQKQKQVNALQTPQDQQIDGAVNQQEMVEEVNGDGLGNLQENNHVDQQHQHVAPVSAVQMHSVVKEKEYQRQLRQMIFGDVDERKKVGDIKPPPTDNFSISHPILANIDHEVIKLTAQFVARNGQKFLQGLTEREARNPQFDFLKPTHGLFGYFTQLVESYSKVLIPRNEQLSRLKRFAQKGQEGGLEILKAAGDRYLWDKIQEEEQKLRADHEILHGVDGSLTEEQMQIEAIDWHEFVVVEKIDLYDDEEMKEIEDAELEEQKEQEKIKEQIKKQIEENQSIMSMPPDGLAPDTKPDISKAQQIKLPPLPSLSQTPNEVVVSTALDSEMKVKKNYQRGNEKTAGGVSAGIGAQKCPKCQQEIPLSEWKEHMKLELMDPKWREEKQRREERAKLNTYADGDEITQNLRRFAQERRDVFPNAGQAQSSSTSQTVQSNTISAGATGQGDQQKIIWDGQATGVTRTTANIAMLQHQQARNLTEAFEIRGQLDPKSMDKLNKANNPVPTVKNIQNAMLSKEQMRQQQAGQISKKPIEDDEDEALNYLQTQLRSEAEWLRLFPGKLNLKVRNTVTSDGNQIIPLNVDSRVTIGALKENLNSLLNNFAPISHLRLRGMKNLPMKDNLTLAFYNIPDGAQLELGLKNK